MQLRRLKYLFHNVIQGLTNDVQYCLRFMLCHFFGLLDLCWSSKAILSMRFHYFKFGDVQF